MKVKKILALVLALATICTLAACGKKPAGDETEMTAQEAAAEYSSLMEAENAIFAENTALWEKLFMTVDKAAAENSQSDNYGEFLLKAIEAAKAKLESGELHVFDCSTFTTKADDKMNEFKVDYLKVDADGHITSYMADVNTDEAYTGDTEVIKDGYFAESEFRSAPYFDLEIDGITRLDTAF